MFIKFVRFIAALAIIASIAGNTGVVHADSGAALAVSSQNHDLSRAPATQFLKLPALTIAPVSSLGVQFVHVATAANIDAHTTIIDNPLTNGNSFAILIVTPDWNPGGTATGNYHDHHIGVFFNLNLLKWGIYNEDGAAMDVGDAFNVIVPATGTGLFVQTESANSSSTTIDNPLTNNNPGADVLVTPDWNPGGGASGTNADFPISVSYNTILSKWTIFDQTGTAMPNGTSFNVFVAPAGAGAFVHTATAGNTGGILTTIDNVLTNGHPNALVFVTPNFISGGVLDEHPTGVFYSNGQWYIFNRDSTILPVGAAFDVLVLVPTSDIFIHTATTANSFSDYTRIDNGLTNSNPNAIVFSSSNLNPGGGSGIYNNHNTGVTDNGSQWLIFNQDGSPVPVNAAFNVLVPNPDASVFVHTATAGNSFGDYTVMDYPLTNGNPNAIILVTQNSNPGNVDGNFDDHPISLMYTAGKWLIINQDGVSIPVGAAFNVYIPTAVPGVDVFVHTATVANSFNNFTAIDDVLANLNPNAIILVTPNFNPGGACGCMNANYPIGVAYVGDIGLGRWAIVNQNGTSSSIPIGSTFNVYVFGNYKLYLPLVIR